MRFFHTPLIILTVLIVGCAAPHKSLSPIQTWDYPTHQIDPHISFSFADGTLEKTGNKHSARWAKRKNIHVMAIRLVNNSEKPVHGTQLAFYTDEEQAEIMHHEWMARKVRQRVSPLMILALPALLIEDAFLHRNNTDNQHYDEEQNEPYLTANLVDQENKRRTRANFNLQKELRSFQLANRVLLPGKPVFGIIGIKSKHSPERLKAVVRNQDIPLFPPSKD